MINLSTSTSTKISGDTLLCFALAGKDKEEPRAPGAPPAVVAILRRAWRIGDFGGKKNQVLLAYPDSAAADGKAKKTAGKQDRKLPGRLLLVGLGEDLPDREGWRQAGGTAAAWLQKTKAIKVTVLLPAAAPEAEPEAEPAPVAAAFSEGLLLGSYRFTKYRSAEDEENGEATKPSLAEVVINGPTGIGPAVKRARAVAAAVWQARDMANEPGNGWTPGHFAELARQLAKEHGFKAKILEKAAMAKLGMGGIVGVNQGSAQPPRLVILEYRPDPKAPTLLLVGKGLTFDSGGISLKPGNGMEEMKYDMCGGAAVLAAMAAIGHLKPRGVNVVAMVPATENLPGPAALKPGDIIRQYGGKTVEVINTDAEGRLILADALAYGVEKYRPAAVIDLATLTGAVIVALGHHRAGLLGNDDQLCAKVLAAGEAAGEPLWRLPLDQEYGKQLKSKVADLKNVDKRDAGTILGAAFLANFVGDTPWVHLDIAGTAWNYTEKSYIPKGPSGFGVRTLVELITSWS